MTEEDRRKFVEWALWKWRNIPSLPPADNGE